MGSGRGRILTIDEGGGQRPILVVKNFNFLPQLQDRPPSTWVYGVQQVLQWDSPSLYVAFLRPFFNVPTVWGQCGLADRDSEEQVEIMWPRLPIHVVMREKLTLLRAGHDPMNGYYCQFAGDMRLFSQPDWWKNAIDIQY